MSDPATYIIQLIGPGGEVIGIRHLRIWPDELTATEYKGHQIGMELARDAMHREGLWEQFRIQAAARVRGPKVA